MILLVGYSFKMMPDADKWERGRVESSALRPIRVSVCGGDLNLGLQVLRARFRVNKFQCENAARRPKRGARAGGRQGESAPAAQLGKQGHRCTRDRAKQLF